MDHVQTTWRRDANAITLHEWSGREWATCECKICICWTKHISSIFISRQNLYFTCPLLHVSDKAVESACWTRTRCPSEAVTVAPVQFNRPSGGRRNQKRPAATRCFTHESHKRHAQNFANQRGNWQHQSLAHAVLFTKSDSALTFAIHWPGIEKRRCSVTIDV